MQNPQTLTIAVSKGRIYKDSMPLLAAAGIEPLDDPDQSRKLIIPTTREDVRLVIIRATDVPTYVEYGAADLGIAGKDVLMESDADSLYEPLDLNIARCRLMTALPEQSSQRQGRLRVATKYAKTARWFYAKKGIQAEIIKLYGSMELAPLVGLADCIVDVVDTGNTLKANGLYADELIAHISSRMIVNQASMKLKYNAIHDLLDKVAVACQKPAA